MIRYFNYNYGFIMLTIFIVAIYSGYSKPRIADKRIVFTSILPQKDFVQRIAGERFTVDALIGPGQDPHGYNPSPDQIARLSEAAVFFRIGIEFEEGIVPKIKKSMPELHIYDLRKGIKLRDMIEEHHHDDEHGKDDDKHESKKHHDEDHHAAKHDEEHEHDDDHHATKHDEEHEHDDDHHATKHDEENEHEDDHHAAKHADHDDHDHSGKDPHIWLSPRLVKQMGITIRDALIKTDPAGKQVYDENLAKFHRELDLLSAYIKKTLAPVKGTELFVFHPAFGYFTDEYGLIQKPVETGGKEPSARDLALLIKEAREHKPKVIFVQPQFARKSAETLAKQIGCAVVPINPLPKDYFQEMRDMCDKIHAGLSGKKQ